MSTTVKNVGGIEMNTGRISTRKLDWDKTRGYSGAAQRSSGTVRCVVEKIEYVWGLNDSKTLEDGIAAACVAQDNRLRIIDSRDGIANATGVGVS